MSDARDDEEIARAILQIVKTDVRRLKSSYHAAADSHGSLDRDGIMEWLPTFGLPMDITPAAAGEFYDLLIEEADANNDGLLQWGEFLLGLRKVGTKDQLRWSWATPGVESKSAETAFNPDAFALKLGQQQPSLAPAPALVPASIRVVTLLSLSAWFCAPRFHLCLIEFTPGVLKSLPGVTNAFSLLGLRSEAVSKIPLGIWCPEPGEKKIQGQIQG